MKRAIAVLASVAALAPAAAFAQAHDHVIVARTAVRTVVQSTSERQQQQRERIQEQRERARERAEQARRGEYRFEETETISRTLKIGSSGELDLSNLAGDITITRGGGNAVQIEAVKIARGRSAADAKEMLPHVTIDFAERGTRADVRTIYTGHQERMQTRRNLNVSVRYVVTAPENTRISAKSLSGDVRVTDIKGDLNVGSTSGDVVVTNAVRLMSARSTSGKVEIVNLRSEVALEAGSISGDVVMRQSRAPRIELSSISGTVIVNDVACSRFEAQSTSGDIEFISPLEKDGRYELSSHSGTIRVTPTGSTGFEIDANSFSGNIQSSITLKDERKGGADYDRRGRGGRLRTLRGIYGDGSAILDLTTFSGTVIIGKQ